MPNINPINPGQLPRAIEWNALAEAYNGGATSRTGYPGRRLPLSSGLVVIKNTSGSDRSRFDCMSLDGTTQTIDDDAEFSVIFKAATADPDETPVILQEPIANNQFGIGCIFGYTLAKIEQASSSSHVWGTPNATNHNLDAGTEGPIKILATPSTSADSLRPVLVGAAAEATDHYLYTLTSAVSAGSGTATIRNMADATEIATGQTVNDPLGHMDGLAIGRRGVCIKVNNAYYAITPYVVDVRWVDPDLEQSKDGTNYTNIDTAEDC